MVAYPKPTDRLKEKEKGAYVAPFLTDETLFR